MWLVYLPSLFFDGDIQLYNDFVNMRLPLPIALTATGYASNYWSIGTAFFWSPFYLAAKLFAASPVNQYGPWFWFWTNFGTIFYGIVTFFLLYSILKLRGENKSAWPLALLAFAGTPMVYYTFVIGCTAHCISAFAVTLFIWYWLYSFDQYKKTVRYLILGILLGLAAMARTQEVLFAFTVMVELILRFRKELDIKAIGKYGVVFSAGLKR